MYFGNYAKSMRPDNPIPLWPTGQVPTALGTGDEDTPTITPFRPVRPNGAAVVVCPGGGYGMHAAHEREPIAVWLNSLGITAFTLKYRLAPRYRYPSMQYDVARAIRLVRSGATQWEIDPNRIGVLGFSAGGHLASCAATMFDRGRRRDPDPVERQSSRPDIAVLCYPVIQLEGSAAHIGSRNNLLGTTPSPALVRKMSTDSRVTPQTSPTFLLHTVEDTAVPVQNSLSFASALAKAGVPFAMQIYEKGQHGIGLGGDDPVLSAWPAQCAAWMKSRKFI